MDTPTPAVRRGAPVTMLTAVAALQRRILRGLPTGTLLEESASIVGGSGAMLEWSERGEWRALNSTGSLSFLDGRTSHAPALGLAFEEGLALCSDTLLTTGGDREICEMSGTRSLVAVRHVTADRGELVLTFVSGDSRSFDTLDPAIVGLLGGFAAHSLGPSPEVHIRSARENEIDALMSALRRENQFVSLLQEVAVAANEAASFAQAVRRTLHRFCEVTGWPVGHLYFTSEAADRLVSTPIWHMAHESRFNSLRRVTDAMEWRRGVGLPGRVLASAKPEWVVDIRNDPSIVRTRLATSLGVRSSFALPLLISTEVVAVLEFYSEEILAPDPRLLEIAGHIGLQLGRVIERKRASIVLATSEQHYRLLFERNLAGVFRASRNGVILDCNDALAHALGYLSREDLRGKSLRDICSGESEEEAYFERLDEERMLTNVEMRMRRAEGAEVWTLVNASLIQLGDASVIEGTLLDITTRKEEELRVEFQAQHDGLTSLYNRGFFRTQLDSAIALAGQYGYNLALLFIDLDGFKPINDTYGHATGDRLLKTIAARLTESVRGSDVIARLGGDEFTILLNSLAGPEDADDVTKKILECIAAPCEDEGRQLKVSASIGLALFPHHGADSEALITAADEAMYAAKKAGGNRIVIHG